ncbi:MAG: prepilin-type N-terminal cleavage/methylation domain-containing protein [Planctomycetes bacterium]|nr:prepilin-type N-terminal cleavage/methylation domain-containing protein [Planctomycetota bacterium]
MRCHDERREAPVREAREALPATSPSREGTNFPGGRVVPSSAFTIVELLVVVAIIGILAGILIPTVVGARLRAKTHATKQQIDQFRVAIVAYNTKYGDFPPSSLARFGVRVNETNNGIESMVACLSTDQPGGHYIEWEEKSLCNVDEDTVSKNPTKWWFGDLQLREVMDTFGNVFVYFHHRDYAKPGAVAKYRFGEETVDCTPKKSGATGAFHNPDGFMIWSIGPNGKNDDGEEDDIGNW